MIRAVLFSLIVSLISLPGFCLDQELTALFSGLIKSDMAKGPRVIAIMPFKAAGRGVEEEAGRSVAEFGVVLFQACGQYKVVERADLLKAVSEIKLAQSGLMNDSAGLQVGKMLSADRLLLGTVSNIFGKRMVSARIVRTETGEVLASASITVVTGELTAFSRDLLGEKAEVNATLFRSALLPGWGQFYTGHPVRGGVSLAAFAGAAGYLVYAILATGAARNRSDSFANYFASSQWKTDAQSTLKSLYDANYAVNLDSAGLGLLNHSTQKQDGLYHSYSKAFNRAALAGGILAGVWALNLADATVAGFSAKKKFSLYFSRTPREAAHMEFACRF